MRRAIPAISATIPRKGPLNAVMPNAAREVIRKKIKPEIRKTRPPVLGIFMRGKKLVGMSPAWHSHREEPVRQ